MGGGEHDAFGTCPSMFDDAPAAVVPPVPPDEKNVDPVPPARPEPDAPPTVAHRCAILLAYVAHLTAGGALAYDGAGGDARVVDARDPVGALRDGAVVNYETGADDDVPAHQTRTDTVRYVEEAAQPEIRLSEGGCSDPTLALVAMQHAHAVETQLLAHVSRMGCTTTHVRPFHVPDTVPGNFLTLAIQKDRVGSARRAAVGLMASSAEALEAVPRALGLLEAQLTAHALLPCTMRDDAAATAAAAARLDEHATLLSRVACARFPACRSASARALPIHRCLEQPGALGAGVSIERAGLDELGELGELGELDEPREPRDNEEAWAAARTERARRAERLVAEVRARMRTPDRAALARLVCRLSRVLAQNARALDAERHARLRLADPLAASEHASPLAAFVRHFALAHLRVDVMWQQLAYDCLTAWLVEHEQVLDDVRAAAAEFTAHALAACAPPERETRRARTQHAFAAILCAVLPYRLLCTEFGLARALPSLLRIVSAASATAEARAMHVPTRDRSPLVYLARVTHSVMHTFRTRNSRSRLNEQRLHSTPVEQRVSTLVSRGTRALSAPERTVLEVVALERMRVMSTVLGSAAFHALPATDVDQTAYVDAARALGIVADDARLPDTMARHPVPWIDVALAHAHLAHTGGARVLDRVRAAAAHAKAAKAGKTGKPQPRSARRKGYSAVQRYVVEHPDGSVACAFAECGRAFTTVQGCRQHITKSHSVHDAHKSPAKRRRAART